MRLRSGHRLQRCPDPLAGMLDLGKGVGKRWEGKERGGQTPSPEQKFWLNGLLCWFVAASAVGTVCKPTVISTVTEVVRLSYRFVLYLLISGNSRLVN